MLSQISYTTGKDTVKVSRKKIVKKKVMKFSEPETSFQRKRNHPRRYSVRKLWKMQNVTNVIRNFYGEKQRKKTPKKGYSLLSLSSAGSSNHSSVEMDLLSKSRLSVEDKLSVNDANAINHRERARSFDIQKYPNVAFDAYIQEGPRPSNVSITGMPILKPPSTVSVNTEFNTSDSGNSGDILPNFNISVEDFDESDTDSSSMLSEDGFDKSRVEYPPVKHQRIFSNSAYTDYSACSYSETIPPPPGHDKIQGYRYNDFEHEFSRPLIPEKEFLVVKEDKEHENRLIWLSLCCFTCVAIALLTGFLVDLENKSSFGNINLMIPTNTSGVLEFEKSLFKIRKNITFLESQAGHLEHKSIEHESELAEVHASEQLMKTSLNNNSKLILNQDHVLKNQFGRIRILDDGLAGSKSEIQKQTRLIGELSQAITSQTSDLKNQNERIEQVENAEASLNGEITEVGLKVIAHADTLQKQSDEIDLIFGRLKSIVTTLKDLKNLTDDLEATSQAALKRIRSDEEKINSLDQRLEDNARAINANAQNIEKINIGKETGSGNASDLGIYRSNLWTRGRSEIVCPSNSKPVACFVDLQNSILFNLQTTFTENSCVCHCFPSDDDYVCNGSCSTRCVRF